MVLQDVHRRLTGRLHGGPLERHVLLERGPIRQGLAIGGREVVESLERQRSHAQRLAFRHVDRQVHPVLRGIQLGVKGGHAGVSEPVVHVERDDALQVCLELGPLEVALPSPGQATARLRGQRSLDGRRIEMLDAAEGQTVDDDARGRGGRGDQRQEQEGEHGETSGEDHGHPTAGTSLCGRCLPRNHIPSSLGAASQVQEIVNKSSVSSLESSSALSLQS